MDYFDFESAMRRQDQPPVNPISANSHSGLPSEELENQSNQSNQAIPQAPIQYGTNYSWMPEDYAPLSGMDTWNNSMEATSSPYFPNAMDMSAFHSPTMQDYQGTYVDSPAVTPGITYGQPLATGPVSPYQDQSANAAMTANSQEMQNWFAHSARRDSRSKKGFPRRRSLYSRNSGVPVSIPKQQHTDWSALDPLQRWQNSPPENEPASITAISHAVASTDLDRHLTVESANSSRVSTPGIESQGFGYAARRMSRPASVSSLESGTSNGSLDSILSGRSANSRVSASSHRKNTRGKVTKSRGRAGPGNDDRPFPCTFCCDTFKNKFDWCRHEKSLHLNPEQWVCTPEGETVTCPSSGDTLCAYCLIAQPDKAHLEGHNSTACAHKNVEARSFKRKDHLIQHLKLVHKISTIPTIGEWKPPEVPVKSRCGFCSAEMNDWKARAEHLSKHFREGKRMLDWRGTHGFEPHVATQVTNSMPPFLIGSESKTPVPFSATKPGHSELLAQISSRAALNDAANAANNPVFADPSPSPDNRPVENNQQFKTAWEVLTFHLGRFAQEKIQAGVVPTDEMFQQESRRLWFDSDDPWNQTFADDTQWMEIFRQEHGLHDGSTPDAA